MARDVERILGLEVPIIVLMGQKSVRLGDVLSLHPGAIIELPKPADSELELMVNNKVVGTGAAVKVGENFGVRVAFMGDVRERIAALGPAEDADAGRPDPLAAPDASPDAPGGPESASGGAPD